MNRWLGPFFRLLGHDVRVNLRSPGFRLGAVLLLSALGMLVYGVHQQRHAYPLSSVLWGEGQALERGLDRWSAPSSHGARSQDLDAAFKQRYEEATEELSARRAAAEWADVQVAVAPEPTAPSAGLDGLKRDRIPWTAHDAAWVEAQLAQAPDAEIGLLTWAPAADRPGGGRWQLAGTLSDRHADAITSALQSNAGERAWREQNPFPEGPIGTVTTRVWAYPTEASPETRLMRLLPFLIGVPVVVCVFIACSAGSRIAIDIVTGGHWEASVDVPMPTGAIVLASALAPNLALLGGLLVSFGVVAAILPVPAFALAAYLLPWWLGMVGVLPAATLLTLSAVFWFTHPWWRHRAGLGVSAVLSMASVQAGGAFDGLFAWTMPGFNPWSEWAWSHGQVPLHPVWWVLGASALFTAVIGLGSWALILRGTGRRREGWLAHHR